MVRWGSAGGGGSRRSGCWCGRGRCWCSRWWCTCKNGKSYIYRVYFVQCMNMLYLYLVPSGYFRWPYEFLRLPILPLSSSWLAERLRRYPGQHTTSDSDWAIRFRVKMVFQYQWCQCATHFSPNRFCTIEMTTVIYLFSRTNRFFESIPNVFWAYPSPKACPSIDLQARKSSM